MKKEVIRKIDKECVENIDILNIIPISNWMITTAYIEVQSNSIFVGKEYAPTFISMQQVLSIGPRVEDIKVGDWVYIDMDKFVKTVKTKSKIVAGIGGQDMITEQLVPPVFVSPGDDRTFFKINDRQVEGVIPNPIVLQQKYQTIEDFIKINKSIVDLDNKAKKDFDKNRGAIVMENMKEKKVIAGVKSSTSGYMG